MLLPEAPCITQNPWRPFPEREKLLLPKFSPAALQPEQEQLWECPAARSQHCGYTARHACLLLQSTWATAGCKHCCAEQHCLCGRGQARGPQPWRRERLSEETGVGWNPEKAQRNNKYLRTVRFRNATGSAAHSVRFPDLHWPPSSCGCYRSFLHFVILGPTVIIILSLTAKPVLAIFLTITCHNPWLELALFSNWALLSYFSNGIH